MTKINQFQAHLATCLREVERLETKFAKLEAELEKKDEIIAGLERDLDSDIDSGTLINGFNQQIDKLCAQIKMKDGEIERWKNVWRSNKLEREILIRDALK